MTTYRTPITVFTLLFVQVLAGGCSSTAYFDSKPDLRGPTAISTISSGELVRLRPIFSATGQPLGWQDVVDACTWAEVIVLGELHDDAVGHAIQLAIVCDVTALECSCTALAMEMLERDEQQLVADYYDDIIDKNQFARLTFSSKWAGEGSWDAWYQPIIDAARRAGSPTIAANAPRRYVRLARADGYSALGNIPEPRRSLFDLPVSQKTGAYRRRFLELMQGMGRHDDPDDDAQHSIPTGQIEGMYRSQLVWDATMAMSVVNALRDDADRVIMLVGQFHSDFNGGTVQEIRRRSPTSNVLTISMQQRDEREFNNEDRDRADIIIYTGARPPEDEDAEVEQADSADEADTDPDAVAASQPAQPPATQPEAE